MPKLWVAFGLGYVFIALLIFLDHFISYEAMWHWDEAFHHEAFFIATIWVATAYLFVALVEFLMHKKKVRLQQTSVTDKKHNGK